MAKVYNLYIDQNVDNSVTVNLLDPSGNTVIDISNGTFYSSARIIYTATKAFDLIANSAANNTAVTITVPAINTANSIPGKYNYDVLFINSANTTYKVLEGIVYLLPTFTYPGSNT